MPAPGQGALGIEIREGDTATRKALALLHDATSATAVGAERALLAALGGGCQAPIAAWVDGARLFGRVTRSDGASQLTASADLDVKNRRPQAKRLHACSKPKARAPYSPDELGSIPDSPHAAAASHRALRRLVAETHVVPSQLVWPQFVVHGEGVRRPIATLPAWRSCPSISS